MNTKSDSPTDQQLASRILAGDRAAFETLVARYQQPLIRVATGQLGNVQMAEEAVQEVFISVYRSLHTFQKQRNFRTWLWTILLNQCRQSYKKNHRQPLITNWSDQKDSESPVNERCDQDGPVLNAIRNERKDQLETLLNKLPLPQATAMRLRFHGGLKFQEIADSMNCSLSAAKNRIRVGLEKLSEQLAEESSLSIGDNNENAR